MKKEHRGNLLFAICLLVAFLLWTLAIQFIDVQAIGPRESTVGFAKINQFVHNLTGVNMTLYTITDWLGLVPLMFAMGFGILGLCEWIKRKHILRVDYNNGIEISHSLKYILGQVLHTGYTLCVNYFKTNAGDIIQRFNTTIQ